MLKKKRFLSLSEYTATAWLCATQAFDGNFLFVFAGYAVRMVRLLVMTAVFRSIPDTADLSLSQMLTYALLSSVLSEQLFLYTPATTALWEGSIINRFTRPVPVIGTFVAETIGKWVPSLLFYTLPVCLAAPLFGVRILPASAWNGVLFLVSLLLGISLSFAVDFIFAAFSMRMKNGCWAALAIRDAVTTLLSGSLIPFALLPKGVAAVFQLLPFGSLAGAPLSIFVGSGSAPQLIMLSVFWNLTLWPVCILYFRRSQEKMVSFGG
ncbi:ABC-2 family transporter protein [Caproiciproducens sp. LBM24188]|nr:hypothetical protein [Oscillospiraceae bacterium]HHV31309.1 hypothetical protein [Clostridiales bacterium]